SSGDAGAGEDLIERLHAQPQGGAQALPLRRDCPRRCAGSAARSAATSPDQRKGSASRLRLPATVVVVHGGSSGGCAWRGRGGVTAAPFFTLGLNKHSEGNRDFSPEVDAHPFSIHLYFPLISLNSRCLHILEEGQEKCR